MGHKKIRHTYINPHLLRFALSRTIAGDSKEELIVAIHSRFYPEHGLDAVRQAYSPKKGWPRTVIDMIGGVTAETKLQTFSDVVELAQKYQKQMEGNNQN